MYAVIYLPYNTLYIEKSFLGLEQAKKTARRYSLIQAGDQVAAVL